MYLALLTLRVARLALASRRLFNAKHIQYDSALYTRLVLSRNKDKLRELSEKGLMVGKIKDTIKDPYV